MSDALESVLRDLFESHLDHRVALSRVESTAAEEEEEGRARAREALGGLRRELDSIEEKTRVLERMAREGREERAELGRRMEDFGRELRDNLTSHLAGRHGRMEQDVRDFMDNFTREMDLEHQRYAF